VINPLENLDESKIAQMENLVQGFYDLVKTAPVSHNEKVLSFINDFDIEPVLSEEREVDLMALLGLEENN
jgi:hypothetical protein